jgi:hypothetical protein
MISSLEVGAVFRIVDEASPVLQSLATQFKELQGLIDETRKSLSGLGTRSLGTLGEKLAVINKEMTGIADKSAAASDAMSIGFKGLNEQIAGASAGMANLGREMKAIAAESRALSLGGGGGGALPPSIRRGTGGHGPGSPHIANVNGLPLGGGWHVRGGSLPAMAAASAIAYGVYEEAEIEDIVARAMRTGQLDVDAGMTRTDAFNSMRDVVQSVAAKTGFSPKEVGEAILTTERQFGGLSFKDRLGLEETLIPYAAAEARMKEASLSESFEAMVGLAHMTGTYDPKQLPELMREFSYASMITPVGLQQFRSAISYSLPMLHAGLDMDPAAVMFLTAMTQTAGVTNTKSGTWLRSFFENAEPKQGDSKRVHDHNLALFHMGLLDAGNHVTWQVKNAQGKTDWDASIVRMSELINKFTSSTDPATRLATIQQAFGERGGGEAALMNLSQFIEQFPTLQAKMKAFRGGDDVLSSLMAGSPVQQARVAWADAQNVMMDIGQGVLPTLTGALSAFDAVLKGMKATLGENVANPIVGGGIAAAVAARFAPVTTSKLFGGLSKLLGWGTGAASLPALIDAVTDDNRSPQAKANDAAVLDWLKSWFAPSAASAPPPGRQSYIDPAVLERASRSAKEFRADPEAAHGRVMSSGDWYRAHDMLLPAPKVDTKVDVKVLLDGRAIAAAVQTTIVQDNQMVRGPSSFDGRAMPTPVDHGLQSHL